MNNHKVWNVFGWISFVFFCLTVLIEFAEDVSYMDPAWLIAAVACWYYRDIKVKEELLK